MIRKALFVGSLGAYGYVIACNIIQKSENDDKYKEKSLNHRTRLRPNIRKAIRKDHIKRLCNESYDLVILSQHNCSTNANLLALSAAIRGLKVALISENDFVQSSIDNSQENQFNDNCKSNLQYVLNKEIWNYKDEFLKVKQLQNTSPHLLTHQKFIIPFENIFETLMAYSFLKIRSLIFAEENANIDVRTMNQVSFHKPLINDYNRLNIAQILTANDHGVTIGNHLKVMSMNDHEDVMELNVKDKISGKTFKIKSKGIIKTTSPDEKEPINSKYALLPKYYTKHNGFLDPKNGFYLIPFNSQSLLSYTDSTSANENFKKYGDNKLVLRNNDLNSVPKNSIATNEIEIPTQELTKNNIKEVLNNLINEFGLIPKRLHDEPPILIGSHGWTPNFEFELLQRYGLSEKLANHLTEKYGDRSEIICNEFLKPNDDYGPQGLHDDPEKSVIGRIVDPESQITEGEIRYIIQYEFVTNLDDLIYRRLNLKPQHLIESLSLVHNIIDVYGSELNYNQSEIDILKINFIALILENANRPEIGSNKDIDLKYLKDFEKLKDSPGKDYVYVSSLLRYLETRDPYVTQGEVNKLFKCVDLQRNGVIFYHEFVEMMNKLEVKTPESLIEEFNVFNNRKNDINTTNEINTE